MNIRFLKFSYNEVRCFSLLQSYHTLLHVVSVAYYSPIKIKLSRLGINRLLKSIKTIPTSVNLPAHCPTSYLLGDDYNELSNKLQLESGSSVFCCLQMLEKG